MPRLSVTVVAVLACAALLSDPAQAVPHDGRHRRGHESRRIQHLRDRLKQLSQPVPVHVAVVESASRSDKVPKAKAGFSVKPHLVAENGEIVDRNAKPKPDPTLAKVHILPLAAQNKPNGYHRPTLVDPEEAENSAAPAPTATADKQVAGEAEEQAEQKQLLGGGVEPKFKDEEQEEGGGKPEISWQTITSYVNDKVDALNSKIGLLHNEGLDEGLDGQPKTLGEAADEQPETLGEAADEQPESLGGGSPEEEQPATLGGATPGETSEDESLGGLKKAEEGVGADEIVQSIDGVRKALEAIDEHIVRGLEVLGSGKHKEGESEEETEKETDEEKEKERKKREEEEEQRRKDQEEEEAEKEKEEEQDKPNKDGTAGPEADDEPEPKLGEADKDVEEKEETKEVKGKPATGAPADKALRTEIAVLKGELTKLQDKQEELEGKTGGPLPNEKDEKGAEDEVAKIAQLLLMRDRAGRWN